MRTMIERNIELKESEDENIRNEFKELNFSEDGKSALKNLDYARGDISIDESIAFNLKTLWDETIIQKTFEYRAKIKVDDSSEHFFNKIMEIGKHDYLPDDNDIIFVRYRTTGYSQK